MEKKKQKNCRGTAEAQKIDPESFQTLTIYVTFSDFWQEATKMCVHLRFVFIDHQSEPLADASMFEIPNRGVVVGSGSADSGANFHQNTSPKTPRPEPNHQEHQQRYNRKGIRGKIQAKHKQEKQPTKYRTILLCFFVHALSPWCLLFRFIFSHNITATFLVFESRCARQARRGSRATA